MKKFKLEARSLMLFITASFIPLIFLIVLSLIDLQVNILLIFVLTLLTSSALGIYFSRKISKPISKLFEQAKQIDQGNFEVRTEIRTGDEFQKLSEVLNETAENLGKLNQERKELDDAKTQFLSISSHELRSPMTPMKAQLQMMTEGYFGRLSQKQKEAVEIVLRNTSRLDDIISDMLELSRMEAARIKFNFIRTSLTPHINRTIKEMDGFFPDKKIKIISKIKSLPVIEVDPDRVMQVLRNLLNNAKKFSPSGSKIIVEAEEKGKFILFSVKDDGIGISPENQKNLFQPFFQAEQTLHRSYGGTGLGLTICKGLIESQRGEIWLESLVGKGTTFYFTVPLVPVRDIKPAKLMFISTEIVKKKLEEAFVNILGPMGRIEFDNIEIKGRLSEEKLFKYIDELVKDNIISPEKGERFRTDIGIVFGRRTSESKKHIEEEMREFFKK